MSALRLRFSLRSLLIVLLVLSAYCAMWWPTQRYGPVAVYEYEVLRDENPWLSGDAAPPARALLPLVIETEAVFLKSKRTLLRNGATWGSSSRPMISASMLHCKYRYYLWIPGNVIELPFHWEAKFSGGVNKWKPRNPAKEPPDHTPSKKD